MTPYYETELGKLYCGDSREILQEIPRVDMIFTDPPYLREYLWTYSLLSEQSARLLEDGGWVFAYGAGEYMRERLSRMDEHLEYFWTFVLLHNGGYPRMWNKKLMSGYKPVFVFTRGEPKQHKWLATVHSVRMDKAFHKWGQGAGFPFKIVDTLTLEGDTVCDPFCGGGTVPVVCEALNRKWIAVEILEENCQLTVQRIENERKQLKLW